MRRVGSPSTEDPAAVFRRRHGGAVGERSTGGLLSAEHTEFTWNQKTWEDKLIQVEAIPPPEARVGGGGGSSWWVWRVGSLGTLGNTFPSCQKTWGAQAAPAGDPTLETKSPRGGPGDPLPAAPKPTQH